MTPPADDPKQCMIPLPEALVKKMEVRHPMFSAERTETLLAVRMTAHCLETGHGAFLAKYGLTQAKFSLLMALYVHHPDPLPSSRMVNYWIGTRANLSQLVTGLSASKHITVTPAPEDARARLLQLAPAGLQAVEEILPEHLSRVNRASTSLSTKERRELIRLLLKLKDSYITHLGAPLCDDESSV